LWFATKYWWRVPGLALLALLKWRIFDSIMLFGYCRTGWFCIYLSGVDFTIHLLFICYSFATQQADKNQTNTIIQKACFDTAYKLFSSRMI
jgi:hypothetical protein